MSGRRSRVILISICLLLVLVASPLLFACNKTTQATTTATSPTTTTATTATKPVSTTATTTAATTSASTTATTTATTSVSTTTPQFGGVLEIIVIPGVGNLGLPGVDFLPGDANLYRPAVESLVSWDEKGTNLPAPQLATGWQISPDYKSITFPLRKGVKFHDGTNFDASAAKYCLDMVRESSRPELKAVSSIDVIDDYTIRLNLSKYEPTFLIQMAGAPSKILSPTALKTLGEEARNHPVGTGPYKFVNYKRDVYLNYERFNDYWGGKPYVDVIQFTFIADALTRVVYFKSGDAQVLSAAEPKDSAEMKANDKYNFNVTALNVPGFCGDSAHPGSPFADIKVRRALAYAIDSKTMANTLGYGFFTATNQFCPSDRSYYNSSIEGYPYDPQKATQLLTEAGYPKGFETKISFVSGATSQLFYTAVQGYLGKVGIKATLDPIDTARATQLYSQGWTNQLVDFSFPASIQIDLGRTLTTYLSNQSSRYDPKSLGRSADYDTLLSQAVVELDPNKRSPMIQKLHKMVIDDYCMVVPVYVNNNIVVSYPKVHDLTLNTYGGPQDWQPAKVWLSK
jgi:peptide/nickel transport system substrate-binding protein